MKLVQFLFYQEKRRRRTQYSVWDVAGSLSMAVQEHPQTKITKS